MIFERQWCHVCHSYEDFMRMRNVLQLYTKYHRRLRHGANKILEQQREKNYPVLNCWTFLETCVPFLLVAFQKKTKINRTTKESQKPRSMYSSSIVVKPSTWHKLRTTYRIFEKISPCPSLDRRLYIFNDGNLSFRHRSNIS